jgi:hypothetical protein
MPSTDLSEVVHRHEGVGVSLPGTRRRAVRGRSWCNSHSRCRSPGSPPRSRPRRPRPAPPTPGTPLRLPERNGQESSWRGRPPWRMNMVLSAGDVGATWCREPDQEEDAGASGTPDCCYEHAPQMLQDEAPPGGSAVADPGRAPPWSCSSSGAPVWRWTRPASPPRSGSPTRRGSAAADTVGSGDHGRAGAAG